MIQWIIPGSVARLTGVTTIVESSSDSQSAFAQYSPTGGSSDPIGVNATGSYSANATFTSQAYTSHGAEGSTTYFSSSMSNSFTEAWGQTGSGYDSDGNVTTTFTQTYSNSVSSSTSRSGQTTAIYTVIAETSTTETYESYYESTYTASYETNGQSPIWTTSEGVIGGGTKTSVAFYQTFATSLSSWETASSTRQATSEVVTALDQTLTLSAFPNTVIQAQTLYPNAEAEVLYLQTALIESVDGYTAASDLAQSGTRFTVSPVIVTAQKEPVDYSRSTSSIARTSSTSLVELTSSTFTQEPRTSASYFSFPPTTLTQNVSGITTTAIRYATNLLSFQNELTYGGTSNTVTAKEFGTYWRVVSRQVGSKTFQAPVQDFTTYTVQQLIEAAASSSTQGEGGGTFGYNIWYGLTSAPGNSSQAHYRSSGVSGNTVLPTAQAVTGKGGQPQQLKFGSIGAAINGNVGGWLTANASSVGFVFFSDIYARDGAHRSATTMFPATNEHRTIEGSRITWTLSTAGVLSVDGTTSKKTTTSAQIGVSGTTQTVEISRPISNFGGSAGEGETFVQTALPGVYKNRMNGSTTEFDGAASVISNGQSQSVALWQAVRDVRGMALGTNANPLIWTEPRNSTNLPPAMVP
jgi:hypothetical protein